MNNRFHRRIARLEEPKLKGRCDACRTRMHVRFDERDAGMTPGFRCPQCRRKMAYGFKLVVGVDPSWI